MKKIFYFSAISFLIILSSCCGDRSCDHDHHKKHEDSVQSVVDFSFLKNLDEVKLSYPYKQRDMNYAFDALEPYIDKETMDIHYSRHHAAYTNNFNKGLEDAGITSSSLIDIFMEMSEHPVSLRNNGGGFYNHLLFWEIIAPNTGGQPEGKLAEDLGKQFGSFDKFVELFNEAARNQFGSGWAWLLVNSEGKLAVSSTPNQDNPLMDIAEVRGIPIMGLDVWEHAYYLHYQNKRAEYIENFWKIINWKEVERRYEEALSLIPRQ